MLCAAAVFAQKWVAHFFRGEVQNQEEQVMVVQVPIYSVTSHANNTIYITLTYDSSVSFLETF